MQWFLKPRSSHFLINSLSLKRPSHLLKIFEFPCEYRGLNLLYKMTKVTLKTLFFFKTSKYSRPLRIICLSAVGPSDGSGSTLRAIAQYFLKSYGLQHRISFDSDTNHIPCVSIGLVSMHPWPCIHMIMYLHDHISTSTWTCIIQMKNFVMHHGP